MRRPLVFPNSELVLVSRRSRSALKSLLDLEISLSNIVHSQATSAGLPTFLPAMTERALRTCVTRLDPPIEPGRTRYLIAAASAPSDALRGALDRRRQQIDRWLEPAGETEANQAYKDLTANMAVSACDAETALREHRGFVEATSKLPLFALKASCAAFRDGTIGDGKWMPKPGQICIEAGKRVAQLAKERREIEAVLTAEIKASVPDLDRKARLLAEARNLGASMSMHDAVERARRAGRDVTIDEIPDADLSPEARRAHYAARAESFKGLPVPPLSPYLREKYGLGDAASDNSELENGA